MTRVLVVDNYDSFTYNLVQYLGELGADIEVVRNDRATVDDLLAREPDRVVVSPGPCTPDDAGISLEVVRRFPEAGVPTLGVCLGHQAMAQAFGGTVARGEPVHGKTTTVEHDGRTIFTGLANPLTAGRYHSLVVDPDLPDCFERTAQGGGVVMGIRHRELPAEGVQFHPESVLTEGGKALLANFLGGAPATAAVPAHGADPLTIVRAWVDAFNRGGQDGIELVHEDFEMTEAQALPGAAHMRGREEMLRYMRGFDRNWSERRWEPIEMVANDELVWMAARLVLTGRQSGVAVDRVWHYVFRIRDGVMLRQDAFDDEAQARRAAGLSA